MLSLPSLLLVLLLLLLLPLLLLLSWASPGVVLADLTSWLSLSPLAGNPPIPFQPSERGRRTAQLGPSGTVDMEWRRVRR